MPIFVKLGLYKIVDENYKPKPIREIPIDEIGDEAGCEKTKQFLKRIRISATLSA